MAGLTSLGLGMALGGLGGMFGKKKKPGQADPATAPPPTAPAPVTSHMAQAIIAQKKKRKSVKPRKPGVGIVGPAADGALHTLIGY